MKLRTALAAVVISAGFFGAGVAFTQADGPSRMAQDATNVTGTYSWTMGGGGGGGGGETTLTLKQDGTALTGTISGRNGDTNIENGTVDGKELKFDVVREFNGNKFTTNYVGSAEGDTIKLKIITTREVEAKKKAL